MYLEEPSWISSDAVNHAVFELLVAFHEAASSNAANLQQLVDSTVKNLCSAGAQEPTVDGYRLESRVLFAILLTIVKQIDADSAQQDHLIKLILSLRQVPLPSSVAQTIDPREVDSEMNQDLYNLINALSSFERDAPLHPRLEDRPGTYMPRERPPWRLESGRALTSREWTNLNAFLARLHTAAPDVMKLDLRGLFAMIEALERPLSPSRIEDVLPAAMTWVIYAGAELQKNDIPYAYYDTEDGALRVPWSKGELWSGPHAFNPARWNFWMERFRIIAVRQDVSEVVRQAARRAFDAGASTASRA